MNAVAANVDATTPLVYLLFDEFPVIDLMNAREQIDAKRFPNFARLARTSTWFRNTTTLSSSTTVAVPVILTGNPPIPGALPVAQNYPDNLFTLLANGYRMKVTESQTRLCPSDICKRKDASTESRLSSLYSDARIVYLHLLSPPKLEDRLPVIDESWGNFGSDTGDELEGELPKVNIHTFYIGRVPGLQPLPGVVPRAGALDEADALLPAPAHAARPVALHAGRACARGVEPARAGTTHELWWSSDLALQAAGSGTCSRPGTPMRCSAG